MTWPRISLLVVDDQTPFISSIQREFRKYPWIDIVGTASTGHAAVKQAEALKPDVILMDLAMPEMGGLEATRLIKCGEGHSYIIVTSHLDDDWHRLHALRAGADAFCSKATVSTDAIGLLAKRVPKITTQSTGGLNNG